MDAPKQPARKVVTRSPVRTVRVLNLPGIFRTPIECESSLERDFVYRAALCPGITELRHQPFQLTLASGRRYTPDFLVMHADAWPTVIEVKLGSKLDEYGATFDEAAEQLRGKGARFVVLDEHAIREGQSHERAAVVLRYRKATIDPAIQSAALTCAQRHTQGVSMDELMRHAGAARHDILHLIATRQLACCRLFPLTGSALIFPQSTQGVQHAHHVEDWFGIDLSTSNSPLFRNPIYLAIEPGSMTRLVRPTDFRCPVGVLDTYAFDNGRAIPTLLSDADQSIGVSQQS